MTNGRPALLLLAANLFLAAVLSSKYVGPWLAAPLVMLAAAVAAASAKGITVRPWQALSQIPTRLISWVTTSSADKRPSRFLRPFQRFAGWFCVLAALLRGAGLGAGERQGKPGGEVVLLLFAGIFLLFRGDRPEPGPPTAGSLFAWPGFLFASALAFRFNAQEVADPATVAIDGGVALVVLVWVAVEDRKWKAGAKIVLGLVWIPTLALSAALPPLRTENAVHALTAQVIPGFLFLLLVERLWTARTSEVANASDFASLAGLHFWVAVLLLFGEGWALHGATIRNGAVLTTAPQDVALTAAAALLLVSLGLRFLEEVREKRRMSALETVREFLRTRPALSTPGGADNQCRIAVGQAVTFLLERRHLARAVWLAGHRTPAPVTPRDTAGRAAVHCVLLVGERSLVDITRRQYDPESEHPRVYPTVDSAGNDWCWYIDSDDPEGDRRELPTKNQLS